MDDMLQLLRSLVAFDTVNNPDQGIKVKPDCWRFVLDHLARADIGASLEQIDGYPMVHGTLGRGPPSVLLMAHLDVVPPGPLDRWRSPPFELRVKGDRAVARGAIDDKGNVVAILRALADLRAEGVDGVAFAFPGDEEIGGDHGAAVLAERLPVKYVVNGDGQGLKIIQRRRNIFRVVLTAPEAPEAVQGRPWTRTFTTRTPGRGGRHSAYFVPGVDTHAFLAASEFLRREGFPLSSVEGAFVKDNVVPEEVTLAGIAPRGRGAEGEVDRNLTALVSSLTLLVRTAFPTLPSDFGINILPNVYRRHGGAHVVTLDIRAMATDPEEVRAALVPLVEALVPEARVEVKEGRGCLYTPIDATLVQLARTIAQGLGLDPAPIEREGASDSQFFSPKGVECIDFGPLGGNVHGPNEYLEVSSLEQAHRFYRGLSAALTRRTRGMG